MATKSDTRATSTQKPTTTFPRYTYRLTKNPVGLEKVSEHDKQLIFDVIVKLSQLHKEDPPQDVFIEKFEKHYNCVAHGYDDEIRFTELSVLRHNISERVIDVYIDPHYTPSSSTNTQEEYVGLVVQVSTTESVSSNGVASVTEPNENDGTQRVKRKRPNDETTTTTNTSSSHKRSGLWSWITGAQ